MPRNDTSGVITLSLLDRLTDQEPKNRSEAPPGRAQSLRELRASLRRDLEWLLNSRRTPLEPPDSSTEVTRSVYNYGLPDLSSMSLNSVQDQARLTKLLEIAVAAFEPRLAAVKVTMMPQQGGTRTLRFVIDGMLRIDPAPEHVSFDTTLELTSGQYAVRGEGTAR
jgi:type VI secretion system protein ImpF